MKYVDYEIVGIRTNVNHPGVIYASVNDIKGNPCVSATLDYCVEWIKEEIRKNATN